uniref:DNA methyltransferase n=1 Tax=uncultured marine virus TaxID=186617 RepID=A0A0F7L4D8_9VIRU|nr:DNA methyltransferase [uncultured marine virus]
MSKFSDTYSTTFTVTAFPKHLYLWLSLMPSVQPSGKPCSLSNSSGVSLLITVPSYIPCLSCDVSVKLGSPSSFILLPFWRLFALSGVSTAFINGCNPPP